MIKIIATNILVLIGLLISIEIAGQLISLVKNNNFLFSDKIIKSRHQLFEPHPYLSVALKKNVSVNFEQGNEYITVQTTELGTRWTGADLTDTSKIRVACLGGSTTFCTGLNDSETWPALLQQKLGDRYAVINYGVPAYKTTEAIVQLALYVSELKPDLVIFYQGYNDMYNYFVEDSYPDYFHQTEHRLPFALLGTRKYESEYEAFKRRSGFFYLLNALHSKFQKPVEVERFSNTDSVIDNLYTRNLNFMFALSSAMNAKEILIGQVLNPYVEWPESPWSIRIKRDLVIPKMDKLNEKGRVVCEIQNDCIYLDFKNTIDWKPEHFWDEMHFTKEGNELFSEKLAEAIRTYDF